MKNNLYLVEELTTGLVDGYYSLFKSANIAREYFQEEFKNLEFIVKPTLFTHNLQDSEMINCSDWWVKRNENFK